ncbi:MAG TPA: TrmH family RNA methyltransferase [Chlamydiales bacterium]|nr:TrmH family RNA methyltransferase [Chlamydiales bacterium]
MTTASFTKRKFLSLDSKQRHKKCAELLRSYYHGLHQNGDVDFTEYNTWISWLKLLPFPYLNKKALADRYHWHLSEAGLSLKEHNLLPAIRKTDRDPKEDFPCSIAIYLDHIRSAYNVGSILRTVEALRVGTVHFSGKTPYIDNEKVRRTAMGAADIVPVFQNTPLSSLPRPIIALETSEEAQGISDFAFPGQFTLVLGNEEYGISDEALMLADDLVQIPLVGMKNSLNVACAFAIAAAAIKSAQAAEKEISGY